MVVLFLILGGTFHTVFHSGYTLTFKKDLEFKHKSYLELAVCPVGTEVFWRQLVITTVLQTVRSDPLRASETLPILTAWLLSSGMDGAVVHVRIHPVWTNVCFLLRNRLKIKTLNEHWEDLCSVLTTHPNLRKLDLSGSVLSKEAMKTLCVKLRQPACKIQNLMWGFPDPVHPFVWLCHGSPLLPTDL